MIPAVRMLVVASQPRQFVPAGSLADRLFREANFEAMLEENG
jgi:hypothetical protein